MKKNYVKLKASLARTAGLMMLLMAMLVPIGALGQTNGKMVIPNNDGGSSSMAPVSTRNSYHYSLAEILVKQGSLNGAVSGSTDLSGKYISGISFKKTTSTDLTFGMNIYAKSISTSETTIAGTDTWKSVSASDLTYSGEYIFNTSNADADGWIEIQFSKPFYYDGSTNVVLCFSNIDGYPNPTYTAGHFKQCQLKDGSGDYGSNFYAFEKSSAFDATAGYGGYVTDGGGGWPCAMRLTWGTTKSNITLTPPTGTTIVAKVGGASVVEAVEGVTVTLEATTVPAGHAVSEWIVNGVHQTNNTFVMPAEAVEVSAVLEEIVESNITVNVTGGNEYCTVTPSLANPVAQGASVTLNVNEPANYVLISLSAKYNDGTEHDLGVTTSNRSFTMPAYPVTVNATFSLIENLTVYDAAGSSRYMPFYVFYADDFTKVNMIMPASDLAEMKGANISAMTFYISSGASSNTANWEVYLKEVNETQVGNPIDVSTATKVYEGQLDFTGSTVTVNFGTPYHYTGNNLLIATQNTTDPGYKDISFTGNLSAGTNVSGYKSNGTSLASITTLTATDFLPKTTFTYPALPGYLITKMNTNCTISTTVGGEEVARAEEGKTVTLACTPNTHFTFDSWNVYKTGEPATTVTVTDNTFEMPAYAVTVAANLTEDAKYAITCTPTGNGTITANPAQAYANETVTLTITPASHWTYNNDVVVTEVGSGNPVTVTNNTFTMPACGVNVTASFSEETKYTVSYPEFVGGYFADATTTGYVGDYPDFKIYPNANYKIKEITVTYGESGSVSVTKWDYDTYSYCYFEMPAANVTVNVTMVEMITVFSEDFETGSFASNKWENEGVWTCNYGGYDNIDGNIIPSAPNSGSYNALMYNGTDMKLSTKGINFADYENLELSFYYVRYAYNSYQQDYNKLRVYYKNASGSWTLIDDSECALANSWTKKTLDLSDITTSSQFQLAFEGSGSYWGNVTVDDIVVTGTLKPDYTITKADGITHGDITISAATAKQGQTITVTPAPEAGYKISMISYTDENGWDQYVDMSKTPYTFTMPAANTTVSAEFVEIQYCNVTTHINGLAITEVAEQQGYYTLPTPSEISGYSFMGWSDADIAEQGTSTYPNIVVSSYQETCQVPASSMYELYAVYAKEGNSFKMVTGATTFNDGEKFIAVTPMSQSNYYYALSYDSWNDSKVYLSEWNYISSDGVITDGYNAFTLSGNTTDGFIIVKDGKHMSPNGTEYSSRYYMIEGEAQTQDLFKFTMSGSGYKISSVIGGTEYSLYQDGTEIIPMNGWATEFRILKEQQGGGYPIDEYYTYIADAPINNSLTINGNASVTNPIIIGSGAVVTVNGTFTNGTASYLTIQDGGQLVLAQGNTGVKATVEKNIEAITSSKDDGYNVDKWYTIGSAVNAPYINNNGETNHVENMIPGGVVSNTSYNLYYLDMTQELPWINYRQTSGAGFDQLENGLGYIYSNQAATTVKYVGELNTANINRDVNEGWNLVANPFAQKIAFSSFTLNSGSMAGYYSLDGTGAWQSTMLTTNVNNNQGILVNVPAATTMTISRPQNDGSKEDEKVSEDIAYIEINVANANYSDRAYAAFTEGYGLPKYDHINGEIQKVYIPQDGRNFAIATMDESVTLFPVNFKAMTTGYYTISLKSSQIYEGYNDFDYLHLIDNMTGEEIDMLLEDGYRFVGSPADNANRFTVKLHRNGVEENEVEIENFVYQNGNSLVISGEGTFQLIDMLGRVVISKEVHGETVNVDNLITGAYIVRMIGNEVKTQKIVIK